jgi:hypothetical protein
MPLDQPPRAGPQRHAERAGTAGRNEENGVWSLGASHSLPHCRPQPILNLLQLDRGLSLHERMLSANHVRQHRRHGPVVLPLCGSLSRPKSDRGHRNSVGTRRRQAEAVNPSRVRVRCSIRAVFATRAMRSAVTIGPRCRGVSAGRDWVRCLVREAVLWRHDRSQTPHTGRG